jgi:hypothetical protein
VSGLGPCVICGAMDYQLSVGGPTICPSCDCGNFGPQAMARLGKTIVELRERLAVAERLIRVDESLARQLSRSMQENAKLDARNTKLEDALQRIQQWSEAYPLAVFPELDFKTARELLEAGGITLDAVSASCMRHAIEGVGQIASEALLNSEQGAPSHG